MSSQLVRAYELFILQLKSTHFHKLVYLFSLSIYRSAVIPGGSGLHHGLRELLAGDLQQLCGLSLPAHHRLL